jgi:hypothetical protein
MNLRQRTAFGGAAALQGFPGAAGSSELTHRPSWTAQMSGKRSQLAAGGRGNAVVQSSATLPE